MKPSNWLFNTAKHAWLAKSDYACVVAKETYRSPNVLELLAHDVRGGTLYTFCEPGTQVLQRAEEVGIAAVYYVVRQRDVARLIEAGYSFRPVEITPSSKWCSLKPTRMQHVRQEVLERWLGPAMPRDDAPIRWLREVAVKARTEKSNCVILVRDGKEIGCARGATLYSFRELTPIELGRAQVAGIVRVFVGVTRHVAKRLGLWPEHLQQETVRCARDEIMETIVEKWNA